MALIGAHDELNVHARIRCEFHDGYEIKRQAPAAYTQ